MKTNNWIGVLTLALFFSTILFTSEAEARKGGRFGKDESITKITSVNLTGNEGERLFLGYKTTSYWLVAGVYLKDDGYVLGVEDGDSYYDMPEGEELARLQASGGLPQILPEYSIPLAEYAFGYSLWIVLAGVGAWTFMKGRLFGKEEEEAVDQPEQQKAD